LPGVLSGQPQVRPNLLLLPFLKLPPLPKCKVSIYNKEGYDNIESVAEAMSAPVPVCMYGWPHSWFREGMTGFSDLLMIKSRNCNSR
jgi:hypothetical protein